MPPFPFCFEVISILVADSSDMFYPRDTGEPEISQVFDLLGIISQQAKWLITQELFQQRRGITEIT